MAALSADVAYEAELADRVSRVAETHPPAGGWTNRRDVRIRQSRAHLLELAERHGADLIAVAWDATATTPIFPQLAWLPHEFSLRTRVGVGGTVMSLGRLRAHLVHPLGNEQIPCCLQGRRVCFWQLTLFPEHRSLHWFHGACRVEVQQEIKLLRQDNTEIVALSFRVGEVMTPIARSSRDWWSGGWGPGTSCRSIKTLPIPMPWNNASDCTPGLGEPLSALISAPV